MAPTTTPDTCPRCQRADHAGIERYEWKDDASSLAVTFRCGDPRCGYEWHRQYDLTEDSRG
jgi:hypothetical protein